MNLCSVSQSAGVNVSADGETVASSTSELVTDSVTVAVGSDIRETMTTAAAPLSLVETLPSGRTIPASSSSPLTPEISAVRSL